MDSSRTRVYCRTRVLHHWSFSGLVRQRGNYGVLGCFFFCSVIFVRLDALALSVIATATWLAGWLAGRLSVTAGIVSKRLNLSENFLDHLVGPSSKHLGPLTPIPNSTGNPFIGGVKYRGGVGKLAIFVRFSTYIAVYLGNGAR